MHGNSASGFSAVSGGFTGGMFSLSVAVELSLCHHIFGVILTSLSSPTG